MKRVLISVLIMGAILAAPVSAQQAAPAASAAPATRAEPEKGLKDLYAGSYMIGTAGDLPRGYSEAELANIKKHYNIVTPENCMKPQPTHPSENTYNFTTPDALVEWAQANGVKVWGHTLLWHSQTGQWFFQGENGQRATRELCLERLKKHIDTVAGRYKGKVIGWDVVNEAIEDRNAGRTENLRNSSWYTAVGPDVLTIAFKYAKEADPDAQLYYNDYNIEQGAVANTGKHASSLLLLKRLIAEGAPIDGVGIQGHWHLDSNLADVEQAIKNYAALGLKVAITELDVTSTGDNSGAFGVRGGGRNIPPENYEKQAEVYRQLFEIFNRHADVVDRVTFWGVNDNRSWRRGQDALLFDGQMNPKPAFWAVNDAAPKKEDSASSAAAQPVFRMIEDGGTGLHEAVMVSESSLPEFTVFRPKELGVIANDNKLPIIAWGNGGCANSPSGHLNFLSEVASHGFLIVAIGPMPQEGSGQRRGMGGGMPAGGGMPGGGARGGMPAGGARGGMPAGGAGGGMPGGMPAGGMPGGGARGGMPAGGARGGAGGAGTSSQSQLITAIDWAIAQNSNPSSIYYNKIDTTKIAVAGMSCGGIQAYQAAPDPRVTTTMICNSGLFDGGGGMGGMPALGKDHLQKLHGSVLFLLGGESDIAYANGMDDFKRIEKLPTFVGNLGVGHGGTYMQPHGGDFAKVASAWVKWQLQGDQEAAKMFTGDPCGVANMQGWTVDKKNIP